MDVNKTKKCFSDSKRLEQWLDYTNTRYNSLQSHMNYMKMLYHDMQPKILETKNTLDSLSHHNSKIKVSDNVEIVISKQMNCNNSLEELSDTKCTSTNDSGITEKCDSCRSPKLESVLPKINVQHKEGENIENLNIQKKTETELTAVAPRTYRLPQSPRIQSTLLSPIRKENIVHEEQNDNWQYPYQNHLTECSKGLLQDVEHSKKSFEKLVLHDQNEYLLQELSSVGDNIKLRNTGSAKTFTTTAKSKTRTKNEKKEKRTSALLSKKGSLCKLDDIASLKFKKRRRKLHGSNSKSTVTTRDTNFIGRKDTKKRKQKGSASNRHILKSHQASSEVVEIYHNAAAKSGSTSVIPSKHSKLDSHTNYNNRLARLATNKQQNMYVKQKCENSSYQHNCSIGEGNGQNNPQKQCQSKQKAEENSTNTHDQNYNLEIACAPAYAMEKCNLHQCQHSIMQASYCDPMITHSYEMPTLASKLKRVNRSYFGRFNFRNIPFVVGTSITPSHNLGLNIQQVLSIMKTRQPTVNGITPLLIRKVSRGIKPVSTLMEQINDQYSKLPHMSSQMMNTILQKENSFTNGPDNLFENESMSLNYEKKGLRNLNLNLKSSIKQYQNVQEIVTDDTVAYENFHKKKDTRSENQLSRCNTTQIPQTIGNAKVLKLFSSQQNVQAQMEISGIETKTYQGNGCNMVVYNAQSMSNVQDSKGIREVLINLHDQFEELNTKYEKLQAKAEKGDDKESEEVMLNLEKELNAKEEEINAVINLYKEVMALKQQMKLLQKKNSYVCISTEVPLGSNKTYSSMPFTLTKPDGTSLQQKLHHRRGNSVITTREPTSIRLAGLLRQIQTFQKQLKLTP